MQYLPLGDTGLYVSRVCLGTMTFGVETDPDASFEQLDTFVAAGGTFIDIDVTAYVAGNGLVSFAMTTPAATAIRFDSSEGDISGTPLRSVLKP